MGRDHHAKVPMLFFVVVGWISAVLVSWGLFLPPLFDQFTHL